MEFSINLFAKKSHINILIIFIITIISFAVFSLWYTNYTISGVMLKNGIKDENIIFNINQNQWKIFLFKQEKGNTDYLGFVNIMKQSNGSYKVSKIVLSIISNKVIVYTNYSDVNNGILRIATEAGDCC